MKVNIMQWTRRRFIGVVSSVVGAFSLGLFGLFSMKGSLKVAERRSVPGDKIHLSLDGKGFLAGNYIELHRCDGDSRILLGRVKVLSNTSELVLDVPYCRVEGESFDLLARLVDHRGRCLRESARVEILTTPFCFGL